MISKYYISALLIAFSSLLSAQEGQDTIRLKEVEINGLMSPASNVMVSVTDSFTMQRIKLEPLTSLMMSSPGMVVRNYGVSGLASVSVRGAASSHTEVNWNGFPVNSSMNGQVDFNLLPAGFSEKVSLRPGLASTVHDPGGMGGSIELQNMPDWNSTRKVRADLEVGSFGSYSGMVGLEMGNEVIRSRTRFMGVQNNNDFSYFNTGILPAREMVLENAGFRNMGFLQEFYYRKGKHLIRFISSGGSAHRDLPPLMTNVESGFSQEFQKDRYFRNVAGWDYENDCTHAWVKAGWFLSGLEYSMIQGQDSLIFSSFQSKSQENNLMLSAGLNYCLKPGLRIGFRTLGMMSNVSLETQASDEGYTKNMAKVSSSVFVEKVFLRRLTVTARLVTEKDDMGRYSVDPGIFLSSRFLKHSKLYAGVGTNHHLPTLNDLYYQPGGNPDLVPEQGRSAELGWEVKVSHRLGGGTFNLSNKHQFYYSRISNWILWQPGEGGIWSPVNIRETYSHGVEVFLRLSWKYKKFEVAGVSAVTVCKMESDDKGSLTAKMPYLPTFSAANSLYLILDDWKFGIDLNYTGSRTTGFGENSVSPELPSFHLMNLFLSKRFRFSDHSIDVGIRSENIMNTQYQMMLWRPMPGRSFHFSLSYIWE